MTAEERQRLKEVGKTAYIREEMVRLGFWPPSPEVAEQSAEAERKLAPLYEELVAVRSELSAVDKEIGAAGNVPALLAEIRKNRIERVRAARAVRKVEKARAHAEAQQRDTLWRQTTLPYLGRDVSAGLAFQGSDSASLFKHHLPFLETAHDIAMAMGIGERDLAWLCFHRIAAKTGHYALFTIPKKRGGLRVLASPKSRLRRAQRWIATHILSTLTPHPAATAFAPGASVVKNAAPHTNQAVVVKVDLKDFFPSVGARRVKSFFASLGYNEGVATVLALLCTDSPRVAVTFDGEKKYVAVGKRALPQGALTSPALSNLIVRKLDARLSGAASALGFVYTRYADDLTFSHDSEKAPVGLLLKLVREIIASEKLAINEAKTQILRPSDRQVITGLVVNGEGAPRVSREDLRKFRAVLHHCETEGFAAMSERLGKDAKAYCQGYTAFIHMARPDLAEKIRTNHPWLAPQAQ